MWRTDDPVVNVTTNAFEVNSAYAWQLHVASDRSDVRLECNERRNARDFLTHCVRCARTIRSPPSIFFIDLLVSEWTNYYSKRFAHSRRRSSARTVSIGMPSPRSH